MTMRAIDTSPNIPRDPTGPDDLLRWARDMNRALADAYRTIVEQMRRDREEIEALLNVHHQ